MSQEEKTTPEEMHMQTSICMNKDKMTKSALGALGVIAGVIMKNTFEQMGQADHIGSTLVGPGLFLAGWVQTARVLADKDEQGTIIKTPRTFMAIGACAAIAVAVMTIKKSMEAGVPTPEFAAPMFMAGWLMIGYMSSDQNTNKIAYLIPALVMLSMKLVLPYQRANNIVDGPGLPIFIAAWVLFIYLNSKE